MYLVLHLSVGLHLVIGMYRLAVKWGPFDGRNPRKSRLVMKRLRDALIVLYLIIGLITLAEYIKIGLENRAHGGVPDTAAAAFQGGDER
jgi:fumarate reductase subunit C